MVKSDSVLNFKYTSLFCVRIGPLLSKLEVRLLAAPQNLEVRATILLFFSSPSPLFLLNQKGGEKEEMLEKWEEILGGEDGEEIYFIQLQTLLPKFYCTFS